MAFLACAAAAPRAEYKIVTASKAGTYIQIGRDLATYVADARRSGLGWAA